MKPIRLLATTACILPLLSFPSLAETDPATMQRVDRLERDLQLMQRQVSRGEPVTPPSGADVDSVGGEAKLEVRLSAMEEELRTLRGKVEENEFQNKKMAETLDKFQRDVDFRFGELGKGGAAPAADAGTYQAGKPLVKKPVNTDMNPPAKTPADPTPGNTTGGDGVLRTPDPNKSENDFSTPRDLYNYAFRLLNQTQYEQAASAFDNFTKKYPKDPLVGNAYYWEGETYYIRRDYVAAADNFRQGFEVLPNGPKAADNLLKLAMSLDALNRDKEACVVLGQITTKFKTSSTSITAKAEQEQKRIGCK